MHYKCIVSTVNHLNIVRRYRKYVVYLRNIETVSMFSFIIFFFLSHYQDRWKTIKKKKKNEKYLISYSYQILSGYRVRFGHSLCIIFIYAYNIGWPFILYWHRSSHLLRFYVQTLFIICIHCHNPEQQISSV